MQKDITHMVWTKTLNHQVTSTYQQGYVRVYCTGGGGGVNDDSLGFISLFV